MFELIEKTERLEQHNLLESGEVVRPSAEDDPDLAHARDFAARRI